MAIATVLKDPNSKRKYTIDWTRWLRGQTEGEVLSGSSWDVPTGLTKHDESFTAYKTVVWISGGTIGANYDVVNHVTTNVGQLEDATLEIQVESK